MSPLGPFSTGTRAAASPAMSAVPPKAEVACASTQAATPARSWSVVAASAAKGREHQGGDAGSARSRV